MHSTNSQNIIKLLDRLNSKEELLALVPSLAQTITRLADNTWTIIIDKEIFAAFERKGLHLTLDHYYSPLPSARQLPDELWDGKPFERPLSKVQGFSSKALNKYLKYSAELKDVPAAPSDDSFFWDNVMYPPLDAMVYYGIIRQHKPRQIIEIGSGFSSEIAIRALDKNKHGQLVCIEPYPTARLDSKIKTPNKLLKKPAEKIPTSMFSKLRAGDILFIDGSHTVKTGSDVNYLVFNVLPLLKKGVLVHIHDIFLPYEYPKVWVKESGMLWNEQYLILAFLMFNKDFSVVVGNCKETWDQKEFLDAKFADFDIWNLTTRASGATGAGLWLVRN